MLIVLNEISIDSMSLNFIDFKIYQLNKSNKWKF